MDSRLFLLERLHGARRFAQGMRPGPLLDLVLENLPFHMQRTGIVSVTVAQAEQAVVLDGSKFHRAQDIEKPDFSRWFGQNKPAVMAFF